MSERDHPRPVYDRPRVADYGTLAELTAEVHGTPFGMQGGSFETAAISGPLTPPPGGPETPGAPLVPSGSDTSTPPGSESGPGGEGPGSGGGGGGGSGGSLPEAGGQDVGGVVSTGGGDASLPFTGFPAAVVAAAGAGLAAAGAALRRTLRRNPR